jgi:hypothetical protein
MSHAVLLDRVEDVDADTLVAVFAAAGFRTALDARAAVARASGGLVVDDADALAAERLRDALAHRGHPATVVPLALLVLDHPHRTKEIVVHGEGGAGRVDVADALGRAIGHELRHIAVLAAASTKLITTTAGTAGKPQPGPAAKIASTAVSVVLPGAKTIGKLVSAIGGTKATPTTVSVEVDEVYVDVVFVDDVDRVKRVRLDARGIILRAGGPRTLAEWAAKLAAAAPSSTTVQRGFAALAAGASPPALKNLRDFDREVAACLWRRRHSGP